MDASKQQWRRAAQLSGKFLVPIVVLYAALLTLTLAVPEFRHAVVGDDDSHPGGMFGDIRHYLHNPMAYLAARSPGARGSGQLVQSKHHMFKLAETRTRPGGNKPHERVLSNVRYPSPIPGVGDLAPDSAAEPFDFSGPLPSLVGAGTATTPGLTTSVVPASIPGSGSGGTGTATGNGNAVVPEPGTWFMLMWGMGLVGFGLRSRHGRVAKRGVGTSQVT